MGVKCAIKFVESIMFCGIQKFHNWNIMIMDITVIQCTKMK